ncbi:MAG TPA: hypothetical protein VFK19_03495 [Sphingomicrobium sp.]|nr:hypothetical protein [Sphingomicrobium sp.]
MASETLPIGEEMLRGALGQMQSALDTLDRAKAPAHIGAHLDLAISELEKAIGVTGPVPDLGSVAKRLC